MQGAIKREDAGRITKKLIDCRANLQKDNVYSCIIGLKEILEKLRTTMMLPADEKQLHHDINSFQDNLASSSAFRHLYGPVTFKDNDFETSLEFMKQLIQIKEEEVTALMDKQKNEEGLTDDQNNLKRRVQEIMMFVERGDFSTARDMAEKDEEATDVLLETYNASGIQYRIEKDYEKAVATFKKALFVRPDDEGLYYNIARIYIEINDWKSAKNSMEEGLKIKPDFNEGIKLLAHITRNIN